MARSASQRKGHKGVFLLLVFGTIAIGAWQAITQYTAAPNTEQQIAATVTSWGLPLYGIASPVDPIATERRLAELDNPIGEVRVQAAEWLASRGVRSSGVNIAAAMDDPGTRRPCQLAKSLGALGDDRWADKLIAATRQRDNADLRVCATIALGDLQSPKAIQALIESYHNDAMSTFALDALSRIADPATLDFFHRVASISPRKSERRIAATAIGRIGLLQGPDPVAALIEQLNQQAAVRGIDEWTLRRLASFQDERAVPTLRELLECADDEVERVWLAAALLAHGGAGRTALGNLALASPAEINGNPAAVVARAALKLTAWDRATVESEQGVVPVSPIPDNPRQDNPRQME